MNNAELMKPYVMVVDNPDSPYHGEELTCDPGHNLVRCKDCKHMRDETHEMGNPSYYCQKHCWNMDDNFFCADGER